MRRRAYRPEVPDCLEGRSLLSGLAHPAVLQRRQLVFILDHMRNGFVLYTRQHDIGQVYSEIDDVIVNIPYERTDGLDASIDNIVEKMRQEVRANVPGAIRAASREVTAVTVAQLKARVRAGDVVVR